MLSDLVNLKISWTFAINIYFIFGLLKICVMHKWCQGTVLYWACTEEHQCRNIRFIQSNDGANGHDIEKSDIPQDICSDMNPISAHDLIVSIWRDCIILDGLTEHKDTSEIKIFNDLRSRRVFRYRIVLITCKIIVWVSVVKNNQINCY